ncbi:hypothetical protein DUNSADRAFT_14489 [Dunaliella salina]|uniref:Uncharacterized protein n=1 Tax=Dunaliella salina TaxID=3046 RepID=A0ABQ7H2N3_DUNSA|nr:hypothetical protein DUNSADRAFT_14489 [Dunaliella salina]|eukprot:KAF5841090.1 hypothetical protein DUNSADRAFT_14489 [Dunaliella salina]
MNNIEMKRPTRKNSSAELRNWAKAGNLTGLKEVWATYLEGDVSEKYKEALGLLSIAINQNDSSLFYWLASELEGLERKWSSLPNALKEGKTTPARLRRVIVGVILDAHLLAEVGHLWCMVNTSHLAP